LLTDRQTDKQTTAQTRNLATVYSARYRQTALRDAAVQGMH